MSARPAPEILSECTFRFSKFLIIALCNSSANSWFDIILTLKPLPEAYLCLSESGLFIKKLQHTEASSC